MIALTSKEMEVVKRVREAYMATKEIKKLYSFGKAIRDMWYEGFTEWDDLKIAYDDYEVIDERQMGKRIDVSFKGELRDEQKPALEEMIKYDNGILHAATAFGKTVVCSAIIAKKKVNTLIILESSALLEQWKDALEKFL